MNHQTNRDQLSNELRTEIASHGEDDQLTILFLALASKAPAGANFICDLRCLALEAEATHPSERPPALPD